MNERTYRNVGLTSENVRLREQHKSSENPNYGEILRNDDQLARSETVLLWLETRRRKLTCELTKC